MDKNDLLAIQRNPHALFTNLFGASVTVETSHSGGYRIGMNGDSRTSITATPGKSDGALIFHDHKERFETGPAPCVASQLGVELDVAALSSEAEAPTAHRRSSTGRAARALSLWNEASPLTLDGADPAVLGAAYLKQRGIKSLPDDLGTLDLRYAPDCYIGGATKPCLVAGAFNAEGELCGVQRIPLSGGTKMSLGSVSGGCVRLGVPGSRLVVAEGVVTALAAGDRFGAPSAATLGTANMKAFRAPSGVEELIIAADNDAGFAGQRAAASLARAAVGDGLSVRIYMPDEVGKDFADLAVDDTLTYSELTAPEPDESPLAEAFDDLGQAVVTQWFLDKYGRDVRFVPTRESTRAWVRWSAASGWIDEPRIRSCYSAAVHQGAEARAEQYRAALESEGLTAEDARKEAVSLRSKLIGVYDKGVWCSSTLESLKGELRFVDWDKDGTLLGLPGGQVHDMRRNETRRVRREDNILTRAATAPAKPGDTAAWLGLLHDLFAGDNDLIGYAQEAAARCALGNQVGDRLFLVHGDPGTGKDTVWGSVFRVLGEYATVIQYDNLMTTTGGQPHKSWMAGLARARMALTSEVPAGCSWNGPLLSQLTGGSTVKANFMRQDHFDFEPAFQLVVLANNLPSIPSAESGLNRRIRVIPMNTTVDTPEAEGDNAIRDLFQKGKGRAQVLRWVVDGAERVLAGSGELPDCAVVDRHTRAYVQNKDDLDRWRRMFIKASTDGAILMSDAREAYNVWAKLNQAKTFGIKQFGQQMKRLMPEDSYSEHVNADGKRGRGFVRFVMKPDTANAAGLAALAALEKATGEVE